MVSSASTLEEVLDEAGHRLTTPRRAVAGLVAEREGHFTAAELLAEARARHPGIGRATVFRALELLTELRLLERIDLPAGGHAYVRCWPREHHHHLVCERCGRVTDVGDLGLGMALERIPQRTGWRVGSHRLELYGSCPGCQVGVRP